MSAISKEILPEAGSLLGDEMPVIDNNIVEQIRHAKNGGLIGAFSKASP